MKSVVSERGQVTIPKALRDRLGIRPGEVLDFEGQQGHLVAYKTAAADPVDAVYGIIRLDGGTDRFVAELRGDADDA
jgi:AbrB family looped-hinge helix DNA binding protein